MATDPIYSLADAAHAAGFLTNVEDYGAGPIAEIHLPGGPIVCVDDFNADYAYTINVLPSREAWRIYFEEGDPSASGVRHAGTVPFGSTPLALVLRHALTALAEEATS